VSHGVAEDSSRATLIGAVARHREGLVQGRLLTDGSKTVDDDDDDDDGLEHIADVDENELPANLWELEVEELQCVMASYGIEFDEAKDNRKPVLIALIERARFRDQPQLLLTAGYEGENLLTDGSDSKNNNKRQKHYHDNEEEEDDDDDDSDFEVDSSENTHTTQPRTKGKQAAGTISSSNADKMRAMLEAKRAAKEGTTPSTMSKTNADKMRALLEAKRAAKAKKAVVDLT
jgi:hypothetical protein